MHDCVSTVPPENTSKAKLGEEFATLPTSQLYKGRRKSCCVWYLSSTLINRDSKKSKRPISPKIKVSSCQNYSMSAKSKSPIFASVRTRVKSEADENVLFHIFTPDPYKRSASKSGNYDSTRGLCVSTCVGSNPKSEDAEIVKGLIPRVYDQILTS